MVLTRLTTLQSWGGRRLDLRMSLRYNHEDYLTNSRGVEATHFVLRNKPKPSASQEKEGWNVSRWGRRGRDLEVSAGNPGCEMFTCHPSKAQGEGWMDDSRAQESLGQKDVRHRRVHTQRLNPEPGWNHQRSECQEKRHKLHHLEVREAQRIQRERLFRRETPRVQPLKAKAK